MRTHDDFMADLANGSTSHELEEEEDTRKRKKTRLSAPSSSSICRDWMIVTGNCHYARDVASFTTYRPLKRNALIKSDIFSPHDEIRVVGVGTVYLCVRRGRGWGNSDGSTHTIVLEGVLHIPEAVCNGFSPLLVGSSMSCHLEYWEGADRLGQPMWFAVPVAGLARLVLAEDGGGESELIPGKDYTLSLYISPEEREAITFDCNQCV
ncbi:uncharacterized protein BJX67DRAFT_369714 [Aspergillus lucknowensis]|uniref:Uncharacterized protein n=1 Tax=Aspergillus lucknowensis TaxID=176173 RepID=A0ABR4M4Q8_9EURO